jgi:hypothetical protein
MYIQLSKAIETMVEMMLPSFSPEDVCFHVPVEVKMDCYERGVHCYRMFHILFHRPGNYTKVLWHVSDKYVSLDQISKNEWTKESDYDSCWRSDGVESPLRKVYQKMRDKFVENDKISEYVSFGFFAPSLKKISIERNLEISCGVGNEYKEGYYLISIGDKVGLSISK